MQEQLSSDRSRTAFFLAPDRPSLLWVSERIGADLELAPGRRRDLASALRTVAKAAGLPLEQIPASLDFLRCRLHGFHPEHAGFSRKRWANIRSEVKAAFDHLGLTPTPRAHRIPLPPPWQALWGAIQDRRVQWGLCRFFRFCAALEIAPEAVDDATIEAFQEALTVESLLRDPEKAASRAARFWNKARLLVPGWPAVQLDARERHAFFSLRLEAFPSSFQADVAAYLDCLSGRDLLREDGPSRPLAAATLQHRREQIRRFASALVRSGVAVEAIGSLADLVEPERFRTALRFMLDRHGKGTTGNIFNLAMALRGIARHHVELDAASLARLDAMCRRLRPARRGMTAKNGRRLRQFADPRNVALFLQLPRMLEAEAQKRPVLDRKGAVLMRLAVAIEILTMCPIRLRNLVGLRTEEHFRWSRAGRQGVCHLAIDRLEVKNRQDLELELPAESADLLRRYLERFQPLLTEQPSPWLFPGRAPGKPMQARACSLQIAQHVFRLTGIELHVHLFRHAGAKIHLDRHPGSYEVIRRVLGHSSIDTTTTFYTGLETAAASRHFDAGILEQRQATRHLLARRRRMPTPAVTS